MNVLQVNKFYHPVVGGVERVVTRLSEGLATRGHDVSVIAARERGLGYRYERNGVDVRKTSSVGRLLSVPISPPLPICTAAGARKVDVVHHHLPNPLSAVADLVVPSDVPTVVTYHSDIVRQDLTFRMYRPVLERFLERVDRILVTSPRLRDNSPVLEGFREKCSVVPLSIDVEQAGEYNGPRYDLPVPNDSPVILFVGRLNYYKGVEYLIDAMEAVDGHLLIVGTGERKQALQKRAADRGVNDRVHFLGYVEEGRLQHCYDIADLFVLPSVEESEAFGLVQLEAMIHGVPVVNTALPTGVPWVSKDGETGLTVPPRDARRLSEAITKLLSDDELRSEYGLKARRRVREKFNRENVLSDVERIYNNVTGNKLSSDSISSE